MSRINGISRLRMALDEFLAKDALEKTAPARYIRMLLVVAGNEGQSMTRYSELADMSTSSASRALLDLGPRDRDMEKGYGLLVRKTDPDNPSKAQYFLSEHGKDVVIKAMKHL